MSSESTYAISTESAPFGRPAQSPWDCQKGLPKGGPKRQSCLGVRRTGGFRKVSLGESDFPAASGHTQDFPEFPPTSPEVPHGNSPSFGALARAFLKGGDLNPGERHSRDTRDDGTVTLCTLRAATVLSRDCRVDFGRPLTSKKVMSHSCDGPGVRAPLLTNIVPRTWVWNPPPSVTPP